MVRDEVKETVASESQPSQNEKRAADWQRFESQYRDQFERTWKARRAKEKKACGRHYSV